MALSLSPAARHQLKNALTAFSLGTLCFVRRWYDLDNLQARGLDYFRAGPPDATLVTATILSSLLLGAVFWVAWFWVEHHPTPGRRKFAQCMFLLVMIYSIESVRRYWNSNTGSRSRIFWGLEAILAIGFVALLFGRSRIVDSARRAVLLVTLLVALLMFGLVLNRVGTEEAASYAPLTPLPILPQHPAGAPRLIWLIFDELDQRVAFERRTTGLALPELDRLRAESVVANHATQTSMYTVTALPSLISSRLFIHAEAMNAADLELIPQGSRQHIGWRGEPNIFARARALGVNAALVGWHHPYCRIMGDEVVHCLSLASAQVTAAVARGAHATRIGVARTMVSLFRRQFAGLADILQNRADRSSELLRDTETQEDQQQLYFQIRDQVYREAADPRIGLLFVHFPTPHMFPIYNRRLRNFELRGALDYFDNLALVDRTVGELRQTLERAGLWEQTSLLITADHGLRPWIWAGRLGWNSELDRVTEDQPPLYVPFILKLAGQGHPVVVDKTFSNIVSADLILAVLRRDISTAPEAAAWLSQRAAQPGTPIAVGAASTQ
jgi:hypothetical protein